MENEKENGEQVMETNEEKSWHQCPECGRDKALYEVSIRPHQQCGHCDVYDRDRKAAWILAYAGAVSNSFLSQTRAWPTEVADTALAEYGTRFPKRRM